STELLSACIEDSKKKGKKGLCILSAAKKRPFLSDPKFLTYKGFKVADEADNGVRLMYLQFDEDDKIGSEASDNIDTDLPHFKECAKHPHIDEQGYVLYYTNQCPFNAKYVPILEETAKSNGIAFKAVKLDSREAAQNAPTPITNYALFHDGEYVTNEQMNDKKFMKLVNS
ncbi:MAG: YoaP domain-containing protein, partial [Eubacterium sp.]|nr:YoaP domain-containing protein [Eubacterium sp.]